MAAPINLEVGLSASSGAAGNAGEGDIIVTSSKGGLLPPVSTDKAWIVWIGLGLIVVLALKFFRK